MTLYAFLSPAAEAGNWLTVYYFRPNEGAPTTHRKGALLDFRAAESGKISALSGYHKPITQSSSL